MMLDVAAEWTSTFVVHGWEFGSVSDLFEVCGVAGQGYEGGIDQGVTVIQ